MVYCGNEITIYLAVEIIGLVEKNLRVRSRYFKNGQFIDEKSIVQCGGNEEIEVSKSGSIAESDISADLDSE